MSMYLPTTEGRGYGTHSGSRPSKGSHTSCTLSATRLIIIVVCFKSASVHDSFDVLDIRYDKQYSLDIKIISEPSSQSNEQINAETYTNILDVNSSRLEAYTPTGLLYCNIRYIINSWYSSLRGKNVQIETLSHRMILLLLTTKRNTVVVFEGVYLRVISAIYRKLSSNFTQVISHKSTT